VLALGPGLRPGYLLAHDMVFVPAPRFSATMLGLTGALSLAVPSDAVLTALAQVLPACSAQPIVVFRMR
jgi:hypothetical protein